MSMTFVRANFNFLDALVHSSTSENEWKEKEEEFQKVKLDLFSHGSKNTQEKSSSKLNTPRDVNLCLHHIHRVIHHRLNLFIFIFFFTRLVGNFS